MEIGDHFERWLRKLHSSLTVSIVTQSIIINNHVIS
jgi:hypothetical protein